MLLVVSCNYLRHWKMTAALVAHYYESCHVLCTISCELYAGTLQCAFTSHSFAVTLCYIQSLFTFIMGFLPLQGGTEGMTLPAHLKAAVKSAPGPSGKTELSWLMRTTYISNDSTERRQQGITEKRAKAERQAQEEAPADTRETQMEAIQVCLNPRPMTI